MLKSIIAETALAASADEMFIATDLRYLLSIMLTKSLKTSIIKLNIGARYAMCRSSGQPGTDDLLQSYCHSVDFNAEFFY
jgi:hypothetical protein